MFKILREKYLHRSNQKGVGGKGEDFGAKFLVKQGYTIIERNWYNTRGKRLGEIDIIARKGQSIIFVEVKSRSTNAGCQEIMPEEQITPQKVQKLSRIAQAYISHNDLWEKDWRIDSLSIIFCEEHKPHIKHIKSIFY